VLKDNVKDVKVLREAKKMGFADKYIAKLWGVKEPEVKAIRKDNGIIPAFRMVDTLHTGAYIPYFYSSYTGENQSILTDRKKSVVLGAGPIRIGQGVEFDYSTVHAVQTIKRAGNEAIIINNNPETVSTDYTTADKLYFEPLTPEDVMNIVEFENPFGVVTSLGGQTAINLAEPIMERGAKIIGTDCEAINNAEDRDAFNAIMKKLGIPQPKGQAVFNIEDGVKVAEEIGLFDEDFIMADGNISRIISRIIFNSLFVETVELDGTKLYNDYYYISVPCALERFHGLSYIYGYATKCETGVRINDDVFVGEVSNNEIFNEGYVFCIYDENNTETEKNMVLCLEISKTLFEDISN
jgi:carbamoyl-phosphate synthase large subunit